MRARRPDVPDYVPRYVRIREEIVRRIEAGELRPGDQIPSLREMCEEFDVSSITARRALLDLVNEGLVEPRGGRGAFVTGAARHHRVAVLFVGYSESGWKRNSDSFGQLVGGIASASWEHDAILSVLPIHDPQATGRSIERLVSDAAVDGLIVRVAGTVDLASVRLPPPDVVRTILIKRIDPTGTVPSVVPDARLAASLAVDHLVELGHSRIALLDTTAPLETWRDHREGFLVAMAGHGRVIPEEYLVDVPNVFTQLGAAAVAHLLSLPEPPTAIVCDSDFLALHIYRAAAEHGFGIPADLSVVSFDDMEFAAHLTPALTTVRLSYYDLGYAAASGLFHILAGQTVPPIEPTPVSLVTRGSTAPAVGAADERAHAEPAAT